LQPDWKCLRKSTQFEVPEPFARSTACPSVMRLANASSRLRWTTVACGGDRDTNCAIVGGFVAMSSPEGSIPAEWLAAREELKFTSDFRGAVS